VGNLADAVRNVSGATGFVRYGAYMSFTVRGFNTEGGTANIMVLTDGVKDEGGRIATELTNIERVEVLKGPASVLYGGEGLAGAVNLIRKKPSVVPAYDFSVAAGSFATYRTSFGATGALGSSKLLYRVDAGGEHADNWRNAGSRRVDVTPSLYWSPTAADRVTAHVSVARDSFDTDPGIPLINGRDTPDIPLERRFNTPQDHALSKNTSLQLHYERALSDAVQLRDRLSYRWYDINYLSAETVTVTAAAPSTVNRRFLFFGSHVRPLVNQTELTAHFRLFGLESRLLSGWEFERFNSVGDQSATASTATTPIDLYNPVETHVTRPTPITGFSNFQNTINGFFVQEHLSLRDNVKLLVGGRQDVFRRWNRGDTVVNGATVQGPVTRTRTSAFSPRVGLTYQTNPSMSFYGSYATSFTPVNTIPNDGRSLEPERGRQFEVGQRLDLLRQKLNITTTFYNLTRRQVAITIASTPTGPIIEQAGEQRSRGAEIDVAGRVSDRWQLTGNYGFTDSIYVDFKSGGIDVAGRRTAFAPRQTANVWSTYSFAHGVGLGLGGRFVGRRFTNFFNDVPLPSYGTLDAAIFYRQRGWDLALNLNNLLDKNDYFVGALYNTQLYPGPPLNALLTLRVHLR
jgi:iron complex outermembrane receptor protein